MAKAILLSVVPIEQDVQLTLTQAEAQVLHDLLYRSVLGGGRRKLLNEICAALTRVGLVNSSLNDMIGRVAFE